VVLNDIVENRKLVEKFITYVMTNNSEAIEYVAQGRFFSSYLYTYKNKDSEVQLNNFIGMSPMVVLSNVEEKTRPISNYEEYINIKKTILNK
ncbi:MAG: carbohydrate ABC transporter substrate-binding protein, partial [Clostridium butyricum]|nr:carbohydrate ABC transporter substrate-binding protein [Clostridium butyricum]